MKTWKKILIGVAALILVGVLAIQVPAVRDVFLAPGEMVSAVHAGLEIKQLETMIMGFHKQQDRWPTEEEFEDLRNSYYLQTRTDNLRDDGLVDRWGEPYNYHREGSGFVITSRGPDRKPGTKDDIIWLRRQ